MLSTHVISLTYMYVCSSSDILLVFDSLSTAGCSLGAHWPSPTSFRAVQRPSQKKTQLVLFVRQSCRLCKHHPPTCHCLLAHWPTSAQKETEPVLWGLVREGGHAKILQEWPHADSGGKKPVEGEGQFTWRWAGGMEKVLPSFEASWSLRHGYCKPYTDNLTLIKSVPIL